jgi:hypothetical protein
MEQSSAISAVLFHSSNLTEVDKRAPTTTRRHPLTMTAMRSRRLRCFVASVVAFECLALFAGRIANPIFRHAIMLKTIVKTPLLENI